MYWMSWKHIVDLESWCKSCILMASVVVYAGISFYVPFRSQDYFFIIQTAHLLCCLPHSFDMRQLNLIIHYLQREPSLKLHTSVI